MPHLELRTFDGRILRLDTHELELIPLWLIDLLPEATDPTMGHMPAELTVYPLPLPQHDGPPRDDWPSPGRAYLLNNAGKLDLLSTMREALGLAPHDRPAGG